MKHIVAYSGGHSSALVAIEVVRRYGRDNVILLNSNISSKVEEAGIKEFKIKVSEYLGVEITYANHFDYENMTPINVCLKAGTWVNPVNRAILCTHRLKTKPAYEWYEENYQDGDVVYFGFDANETSRITRRSQMMGIQGYKTDYPLALWKNRTITCTEDIGIARPTHYSKFKHANCTGCPKAGWQHWYVVYCFFPDLWQELKDAEETMGYSVHKDYYAKDKEPMFLSMKNIGIEPTENKVSQTFWADTKRTLSQHKNGMLNIDMFSIPVKEASVECTGDCTI